MVLCVIEHEQWARGLQMCVAIKKSKLTTKTQSCALPCRRTGLSRQMNATRWSSNKCVDPSRESSIRCTPVNFEVLCDPTYRRPLLWSEAIRSQFESLTSGSHSWRSPSVTQIFNSRYSRPLAGGIVQYSRSTAYFCDSQARLNKDSADSYSSFCNLRTSITSPQTNHFPIYRVHA